MPSRIRCSSHFSTLCQLANLYSGYDNELTLFQMSRILLRFPGLLWQENRNGNTILDIMGQDRATVRFMSEFSDNYYGDRYFSDPYMVDFKTSGYR